MRPVIICCSARNELHNLSRLIPAWRQFADHIVIADQMSSDGSREFYASYDNIHVVDNNEGEYNEQHRIPLMLKKARSLSSSGVLLFIDADETLSANVSKSLEWQSFLNAKPGTTGFFQWITLWGSIKRHIVSGGVGRAVHLPVAFVDYGRPFEGTSVMDGPRGPGMTQPKKIFYFNDVVLLHFFLTNQAVYRKKQNWYKLFWLKNGGKYFHTNRNHCLYDHVGIDNTASSTPEWYLDFEKSNIDLSSACSDELLWYDVEILQHVNRNGARALWLADIWNQDWEHLRTLALKAGHPDIPETPMELSPKWVLRYNDWTLGRITARATLRSLRRLVKRRLLP